MTVIQVAVIVIVVGILLWLVNRFLAEFMHPTVLKILNGVVIIGLVLWLLLMLLRWAGLA